MTEWEIQPRSSACTSCQQPFADQAVYHTLLAMTADGFARQDLCAACFGAAGRVAAFSYWQGEYKEPPPPPPEPIQKETAESLLRKLLESKDPAHAATRYILGVMLERKRILKHRDTITDEAGEEILVYEHARTGESFLVPDPHLRLDQLADVQQQVMSELQRDGGGPNSDGTDPAGESAPSEPAT